MVVIHWSEFAEIGTALAPTSATVSRMSMIQARARTQAAEQSRGCGCGPDVSGATGPASPGVRPSRGNASATFKR